MSNEEDYAAKLSVITAIADDQIKTPNHIPVSAYAQEAENLYKWCLKDETALTGNGLSWDYVTDLPVRAGTLHEAESIWSLQRYNREEAAKLWAEQSPLGYELRDRLLHDFRYAYRDDAKLLDKVNYIAEGASHADMIQDLNDLAVLGKKNLDPLTAINYDMTLLDQAATMADSLASLYSDATTGRLEYNEAKKIRDQAYTHLKEAVDGIYACGQYVFWQNEDRLAGYRSNYLRLRRMRSQSSASGNNGGEPDNSTDVVDGSNVSDGSA